MSTVTPDTTRKLGSRVRAKGAALSNARWRHLGPARDASVGLARRARRFRRAKPILEQLCRRVGPSRANGAGWR